MKCFTVKIGDSRYIANVSRVIKNGWYSRRNGTVETVKCEDDAKHYKTKGQASTWIKSNRTRYEKQLPDLVQRVKDAKGNQWNVHYYQEDVDRVKEILKHLDDARVVELDIDYPNFYNKDAIKFDEYQSKYGGMDLRVDSTAKRICKCCGVKMKNIPYFEFRNSNSFRVCALFTYPH